MLIRVLLFRKLSKTQVLLQIQCSWFLLHQCMLNETPCTIYASVSENITEYNIYD